MKVLAPAVTCLLTSHMKPYLRDALNSVLAQVRRDIQVIVADSGQWIGCDDERSKDMALIHADFAGHPLVEWVTTGEGPGLGQRACPVAWASNQVIRAGLVRGRYMCTFYDDDVYDPRFTEVMAGFLDAHPGAGAVWCSEFRAYLRNGAQEAGGIIPALGVKVPGQMDCQVDGAQVMWRRELLDKIGDPWLPEDAAVDSCRHSDGIFLERLAAAAGEIPPVGEALVTHRYTPLSTYTPS